VTVVSVFQKTLHPILRMMHSVGAVFSSWRGVSSYQLNATKLTAPFDVEVD